MLKKFKNFNEELKFVNFKDLDNWSVKDILDKRKTYTSKKSLNLSLSDKIENILNKYSLHFFVEKGNYLNKQKLLISDEKDFKEYRVDISKKLSFKDWLIYEYGDNIENFDDYETDKYFNEYDNYLLSEEDEYVQYSVFINSKDIKKAALVDSLNYLKILYDSFNNNIFKYTLDYHTLDNETESFIKFVNLKNIKINNNNLSDVPIINIRLRKDSKVFHNLEKIIGKDKMLKLLNELLNV